MAKAKDKVVSLTQAQLDEDLNHMPTWTGNSLRVTPFLEAVAHDLRHGTYHAANADQFEAMVEAVKNYFEELVITEGAEMHGLDDLLEAEEYVANGRREHVVFTTEEEAEVVADNVVPLPLPDGRS